MSEPSLTIYNRQRTRSLKLREIRTITRHLLHNELSLSSYDLAVHLVAAAEMTHLNETHLHHQGSTDVITFNYSERPRQRVSPPPRKETRAKSRPQNPPVVLNSGLEIENSLKLEACSWKSFQFHGEIFVCLDEAVVQARRFCTSWQSEVVRYLVHGVLHLLGYDDLRPVPRRRMKRAESRLLRNLSKRFKFRELAK